MTAVHPWGFYGRQEELTQLRNILARDRWFFVQIAGRRRIGKTSLIQQAPNQAGSSRANKHQKLIRSRSTTTGRLRT